MTAPQNVKREAEKWFEMVIRPEHNVLPEKLSVEVTCLNVLPLWFSIVNIVPKTQ